MEFGLAINDGQVGCRLGQRYVEAPVRTWVEVGELAPADEGNGRAGGPVFGEEERQRAGDLDDAGARDDTVEAQRPLGQLVEQGGVVGLLVDADPVKVLDPCVEILASPDTEGQVVETGPFSVPGRAGG